MEASWTRLMKFISLSPIPSAWHHSTLSVSYIWQVCSVLILGSSSGVINMDRALTWIIGNLLLHPHNYVTKPNTLRMGLWRLGILNETMALLGIETRGISYTIERDSFAFGPSFRHDAFPSLRFIRENPEPRFLVPKTKFEEKAIQLIFSSVPEIGKEYEKEKYPTGGIVRVNWIQFNWNFVRKIY